MEKNICPMCRTENEVEYKFCKNCGNPLLVQESQPETQTENVNARQEEQPVSDNQQVGNYRFGYYEADDYGGVSTEEMAAFIGKKASDILPKFTKMEIAQTKVSWCWPAAILGLILGPMGSALWFFYRKMFKPAVIFAVIGAVITVLVSAMTFGTSKDIYNSAIDSLNNFDFISMLEAIEKAEASLTPAQRALEYSAGLIEDLVNISSCVAAGIYGFYFYKNHCVNKITSYRLSQADQRYYKIGLASVGGVSGGMLVVGILTMLAVENIVSFVTSLISVFF